MNYQIEMTRKTYNGLCRYLQTWGGIYGQPNAVVLKGSLRNHRDGGGVAIDIGTDASLVSYHFTTARHALGRAMVKTAKVTLDLRDLADNEMDGLVCAAMLAKLKPQQANALDRISKEIGVFLNLPAMVRIALSAKD